MSTYGNTGNEGQRGNDGAYNGGTYGTQGNEPSRHDEGYDPNTLGPYGNEPARHRDINIFVQGNRNPVSMTASLDWTLDTLHSSSAERCIMDPSQCYSTHLGKPLSGPDKVHTTAVQHGSTVVLNGRLKGG